MSYQVAAAAGPLEGGGDEVAAAEMILIDGQRADLQRRVLPSVIGCTPGARPVREAAAELWAAWQKAGPEVYADELATRHRLTG